MAAIFAVGRLEPILLRVAFVILSADHRTAFNGANTLTMAGVGQEMANQVYLRGSTLVQHLEELYKR